MYLHDTLLRSVGFFPGATPSLRFVFEYDADWTPSELQDRPFVIFEFDDVRELEWQEDAESREAVAGGDEVAAAAGQVSLFDWDGVDWFDVHTLLVRLSFRAARVAVRVTSKGDG